MQPIKMQETGSKNGMRQGGQTVLAISLLPVSKNLVLRNVEQGPVNFTTRHQQTRQPVDRERPR